MFTQDAMAHLWDEHIQRQLYYLTNMDGNFVKLNFIGKIENFDNDWKFLRQKLKLPPETENTPHMNPHKEWTKVNYTDNLITKAICEIYENDYLCFDYEMPTLCTRTFTLRDKKDVVDKVRKKVVLAKKK